MTTPQIAVYYDTLHPALYVKGEIAAEAFPPMSLSALVDGADNIEIFVGQNLQRVVGPVPFGWICNSAGQTFASSALTLAYLNAQFALAPSGSGGSGAVFDEFFATNDGAFTRNYGTTLPSVLFIYVNGLLQSSTTFTISGVTLSVSGTMGVLNGDTITITT